MNITKPADFNFRRFFLFIHARSHPRFHLGQDLSLYLLSAFWGSLSPSACIRSTEFLICDTLSNAGVPPTNLFCRRYHHKQVCGGHPGEIIEVSSGKGSRRRAHGRADTLVSTYNNFRFGDYINSLAKRTGYPFISGYDSTPAHR